MPWLHYIQRHAPGLCERFRPADDEVLEALVAPGPTRRAHSSDDEDASVEQAYAAGASRPPWLPPVQRELLALIGGNEPGELAPILPDMSFDAAGLLAWRREQLEGAPGPWGQPGWSPLMRTLGPLHPSALCLAPTAVATPADERGRLRVVTASLGDPAHLHAHARNASLLEFLLLDTHCFVRREACEHSAVLSVHPRDDEHVHGVRGRTRRDIFLHIATSLELEAVPGTGDWWYGYERDDVAMWCFVGHDGQACEVALMAEDGRRFRELMHLLIDNLELFRAR